MKIVIAALLLSANLIFANITPVEQHFNVRQVELLKQMTAGYEKSLARIYKDNHTYPVWIDPDGTEITVIVKNDKPCLVSVNEFYKLSVVK